MASLNSEPTSQGDSYEWSISGMDCGSCTAKIRDALRRLPGVSDIEIGLMSERLRLRLDAGASTPDTIEKTVRALGFGIVAQQKSQVEPQEQRKPAQRPHHDHQHQHGDPQDHGQSWYNTGKGRLALITGDLTEFLHQAG